jgi:hypothetical protein
MTNFSEQFRAESYAALARRRAIFVDAATEVQRSVTVGSEITGAPGQPVASGALRDSWIPEFLDANTWRTSTNLPYALPIEEGVGRFGPLTLRSAVGGFHSVALTIANFDRIVEQVRKRDEATG